MSTIGEILGEQQEVKTPATESQGTVKPGTKPQGTVKPGTNYEDFAKMTEAPESEEQKVKRLKGQRSAKILAGVGDLVSSLANLYFAHRGAKSSFDPKQGLSAKAQERFDKIDKEHEDYKKWYNAEALRAMKADKDAADKLAVQQALEHHRAEQRRIQEENYKAVQEIKRQQEEHRVKEAEEKAAQKQREFDAKVKAGYFTKGGKGNRVGGYTTTKYDKNGKQVSTTVREPAVRNPAGRDSGRGQGTSGRGSLLPRTG